MNPTYTDVPAVDVREELERVSVLATQALEALEQEARR